ncbi:MAG: DMT family transporter [Anaerolineae bacterium]|nr:DMT family transporter [Anaerolineae bacterium]
MKQFSPHSRAVWQALLVTFLWSTSWVFIKFGLAEIPALTFAGLRYSLAFLCLLPFAWRSAHLAALRRLSGRDWFRLAGLGLIFYTVTQGTQFVGLAYLPAATVNLLLSFSAVVVSLMGIFLLAELPTRAQWGGVGLYLLGAWIFFYPARIPAGQLFGLLVVGVGILANAASGILGRHVNQAGHLPPLTVTLVSMGIGSIALLIAGVTMQGFPSLSLTNWLIIGWLAVVNTAFAFTLWNLTLRTLSALESSLINNAMLIQIPILAWLFLGEAITGRQGVGLILAGAGIVLVQLFGRQNSSGS